MYRISELAEIVGLSRSTLLYYEKIGLITSKRQANGYRQYTELDVQKLRLLLQLQSGGLTLKECQDCMEAKIDRKQLTQRLNALDAEIMQKEKARALLAALLGMGSMRAWHQTLESQAPEAHLNWLMKQGFSEKQALRLKWLSKDMNAHEEYMAEFEKIFEGLERLGPGSDADTQRALTLLPSLSGELLEVGCGKGVATVVIQKHSQFAITALDNDEYCLSCLKENFASHRESGNVKTVCASMTDMPFSQHQFDVIWSEGSAYIMGVQQAIEQWKHFLKPHGLMVLSDLVWLTDSPDAEVRTYWQHHYPDMSSVANRMQMMEQSGFKLVENYQLSPEAWKNYLQPLKAKIDQLDENTFSSNALNDIQAEIEFHNKYLSQYGYQIFILERK